MTTLEEYQLKKGLPYFDRDGNRIKVGSLIECNGKIWSVVFVGPSGLDASGPNGSSLYCTARDSRLSCRLISEEAANGKD